MATNCADWRVVRRKNPKALPRVCLMPNPCDCGSGDCCGCGWPMSAHANGGKA